MVVNNNTVSMRETPFDGVDIYYSYDQENIPVQLRNIINIKKPKYTIADKEYTAIYLGYDVAQEMRDEKKFSKIFDTIEENGKNYIIA